MEADKCLITEEIVEPPPIPRAITNSTDSSTFTMSAATSVSNGWVAWDAYCSAVVGATATSSSRRDAGVMPKKRLSSNGPIKEYSKEPLRTPGLQLYFPPHMGAVPYAFYKGYKYRYLGDQKNEDLSIFVCVFLRRSHKPWSRCEVKLHLTKDFKTAFGIEGGEHDHLPTARPPTARFQPQIPADLHTRRFRTFLKGVHSLCPLANQLPEVVPPESPSATTKSECEFIPSLAMEMKIENEEAITSQDEDMALRWLTDTDATRFVEAVLESSQ